MKGNAVKIGDRVEVTQGFEGHSLWIGRTGTISEEPVSPIMKYAFVVSLDATNDENADSLAVYAHEVALIND